MILCLAEQKFQTKLQVVLKAISWIHIWSLPLKEEDRAPQSLVVTDGRWSFGIYSNNLVGGLLVELVIHKAFFLHLFL